MPDVLLKDARAGVAGTRMFTFSTSSSRPEARVRCHNCDWKTSGRVSKIVFARADKHNCLGGE